MKDLAFRKMHGSGNDFILVDNREGRVTAAAAPDLARRLCRRKYGVGADGLILVERSETADFRWRFLNADGSEAEMCGNGGRCAARFAVLEGIAAEDLVFETLAGRVRAEVRGRRVKLQLPDPTDLREDLELVVHGERFTLQCLNTSVPHAVLFLDDVETAPVYEWGRSIRHHEAFAPAGTNVDFVQVTGPRELHVRTYERGVEDETLACGTGAVASALLAALAGRVEPPVTVRTWGGENLAVHFEREGKAFRNVFLEGDAVSVYAGRLDEG
ncbi:diaminopimelate epimerase [Dissulfurirhabdus thermomarina]|uniref:Diaminopimelate epimerase n=2 Tax=Dissulfurirhabdus thermomarina TaxID=1765737 RepID=A0A6N9TNC6_DISTH|nr:diaminopimelate epimerase [Dissulfurirhabdus thermomarina]NMX22603.1 diaminopimelate epimerase [Dissulfurirhabdus thermomarina]